PGVARQRRDAGGGRAPGARGIGRQRFASAGTAPRGAPITARAYLAWNQSEDKYDRRPLARPALRRANVDETPRLRCGGRFHTRARDQREHHDLLDHQRLLLQAVAGEGPGPACTGAAKERRLENAARPLLARLSRLS